MVFTDVFIGILIVGAVTCAESSMKSLSFVNFMQMEEPPDFPSYLPSFDMPLYRTSLNYSNTLLYLDGPITLNNFVDDMYLVITSDNYADFKIHLIDTDQRQRKIVQLEPINSHPMTKDFDVLVLEGLDANLVPICRTSVLLLTSKNDLNMYRMTFTMGGQEYIILNYYYFKWFLGLLTLVGLLILFIELHEMVVILLKRRSKIISYEQINSI